MRRGNIAAAAGTLEVIDQEEIGIADQSEKRRRAAIVKRLGDGSVSLDHVVRP